MLSWIASYEAVLDSCDLYFYNQSLLNGPDMQVLVETVLT
jgi:hypothetical protein